MSATAPSGTAAVGDGSRRVFADAALAVDLGRADDGAEQRPGGALRDRDVVRP